ncbi:MAG TPA: FHA domain-containing protein [Chthonomonadaceae bacterium]|nr:FHA domain-containing protein [Chthonomonadaceae bacterium]
MTRRNWYLLVALLTWSACLFADRVALAQGGTPPAQSNSAPPSKSPDSSTGAPKSPPNSSGAGNTATPSKETTPAAPLAVMQIKKNVTGDFTYRFLNGSEAPSAPAPLPTVGPDNIITLPVPSTIKSKDAQLEITDSTRGNIARLPVTSSGVTPLDEQSFKFAQRISVPVQAKGQAVVGAQVTLLSKTYNKTELTDNTGMARFENVPIGEQITASATYGQHTQESLSRTLERTRSGEAWPPILVDWTDAKLAPLPAPPGSAGTAVAGTAAAGTPTTPSATSDNRASGREEGRSRSDTNDTRPAENSNPLTGVISTVIGLLFLGALAYGFLWAWNKGHIKTAMEKAGINLATPASTAVAPNPFDKPAKAPITPITEGTADPFGGGGMIGGGVAAAPVVAAGPRLVATMGTYAGNIFPISGGAADIGRDAGNAIPLPNDTNASRRHATIQVNSGQYAVVDNGSSNGTFLNGVRIASQVPQPLRPGDEVQVGLTRFRFEA